MKSVRAGTEAIRRAFANARNEGTAMAIVDATSDADLTAIGAACYDLPLLTGGSGIAMGLPANFRAQGLLAEELGRGRIAASGGLGSGGLGQLLARHAAPGREMKAHAPAFQVDPLRLASGADVVTEAVDWASARLAERARFGLRHGRCGHGEVRAE